LVLNLSPASLKGVRLEAALRGGNEVLRKEDIPRVRSTEANVFFNVGKLPVGRSYSIEVRLLDATGATLAQCARPLVRIAGPFDAPAK
jgi:hypothetical protein